MHARYIATPPLSGRCTLAACTRASLSFEWALDQLVVNGFKKPQQPPSITLPAAESTCLRIVHVGFEMNQPGPADEKELYCLCKQPYNSRRLVTVYL